MALAVVAFPASAGAISWNQEVKSVPGLRIPRVFTTVNDKDKAPGNIFITPRVKGGQRTGPTILDANGKVVWFHRLSARRTAIGLEPQTYRGKPVITWGQRPPLIKEGDLYSGEKRTVYNVIADTRYHIIARVRARGRDIHTDLHEFQITKRNTALVLAFRIFHADLSKYGGPKSSAVLDNVVQEIDIRTGRALMTWSAVRHLSPRWSYVRPPKTGAWDAYHINAISEDSDGNLLLTARHMSAVYKIARRSGRVMWKLGGKRSDFRISGSASFYYPHAAQRAPDGSLTIFDNRATALDKKGASRALHLHVDSRNRRVTVAGAFRHPTGSTATSQGNMAELPNGNFFVGWGSSPWLSEYAPDGRLLYAAHMRSAWNQSYRAFKGEWHATPDSDPAIFARVRAGRVAAYVSWNGATEVASWRLMGGPDPDHLSPIGTAPRTDFETKLGFDGTPAYVQAQALDASGKVIGLSAVIKPKGV
ncbi:MAG TPA: arylsulfotransferase family protein [Burkholderiaceae bacterium]|nr:arylsulfotransferase family protein [Burkholderiaceae bacterium]